MLELYIIRHGLAGSPLEDEKMDEERPLEKKGKAKMKKIGKSLKKMNISFDQVLTSPLLRAKETAEIINKYCGIKDVIITDLLKPGSSYLKLIKFLNELKDLQKVAIVGHEPFLSSFASYCLTKSESSYINLKKGGVLVLEINKVIKPNQCKLSLLIQPKYL